ncbi:hypothetical protein ADICYQ_0324 [Cyclobacterium qasimii M12-11B]|uniref:Uncharacterized protein n=1 Tax=Cyclobacterium qasimii M12-11B TaxID=641524 RepID=S7VMS5_9BACT|nr:hypothetical protein ADICYQ_0324 [Cyclobacterium qasimii M12-11B]
MHNRKFKVKEIGKTLILNSIHKDIGNNVFIKRREGFRGN